VPRPALLLDVDGVLNPYGTATCPEGFTEYDLFPGEEPVRLRPAHGEWISELRHVFDVAWATAWNDDANRLLAPLLGITALPVVTGQNQRSSALVRLDGARVAAERNRYQVMVGMLASWSNPGGNRSGVSLP